MSSIHSHPSVAMNNQQGMQHPSVALTVEVTPRPAGMPPNMGRGGPMQARPMAPPQAGGRGAPLSNAPKATVVGGAGPRPQAPAAPPAPPPPVPIPEQVLPQHLKTSSDAVSAATAPLRTTFAVPMLEYVASIRRMKKLAKLVDPTAQLSTDAAAFIDDLTGHFIEDAVAFAAEAAKLRTGAPIDNSVLALLDGPQPTKKQLPSIDAYDLAFYCKEVFPFLSLPLPPFNKNRPVPTWVPAPQAANTGMVQGAATAAGQPIRAAMPLGAAGMARPNMPRPQQAAVRPLAAAGIKRKMETAPQGGQIKRPAP